MDNNVIIHQILMLFLIIFVGYVLRKKRILNEQLSEGLSQLLVEVTMPALIVSSMTVTLDETLITNIKLISLITAFIYIFLIIFSNILSRFVSLDFDKKRVFVFALVFGNVGFMGYPVLDAIYPELGIFYGVFNNIAFNILVWTYGIFLFTSKENEDGIIQWKNLINNGIIAIIIGFTLLFTGYRFPDPVTGAIEYLGEMTFPLSMLIIGSSLATVSFKQTIRDLNVILLTAVKLLIIPFICLLILNQFPIPEIIKNVTIILTAMPSAANTVVFAERFDSDHKFASQGVFITTLFSLLTIPIFVSLLNFFG